MSFRDETETLRARIAELEDDLRQARRERDEAREALDASRRPKVTQVGRSGSGPNFAPIIAGVVVALATAGAGFYLASGRPGGPPVRAPWAGLDPAAVPTAGMLDLDATPEPGAVDLVASGDYAAPSGCMGYVPDAPQIVIRSSHPMALRVSAEAMSGGDLVAVVLFADGQMLCDDDGDGSLNPRVTGVAPAGDTRVWIGTYSSGNSLPFRLHVHADSMEPPPVPGTVPVVSGPDGHGETVGVLTAAPIAASTYDPGCRGYVPTEPQLTLHLTERAAVHLAVTGTDDLVLLVREPDHHVKCDDDSGVGALPELATMLGPGDHLVYVGTYSTFDRPTSFGIRADVIRVSPDAAPTLAAHTLATPGEAFSVEGTSAATIAPTALGADCTGGLVPAAPHVRLDLPAAGDVVLSIAGAGSPFVVVAHEGRGFECLTSGHVRASFAAGAHRIYVGVPNEGVPGDFTLQARLEAPTIRPWSP